MPALNFEDVYTIPIQVGKGVLTVQALMDRVDFQMFESPRRSAYTMMASEGPKFLDIRFRILALNSNHPDDVSARPSTEEPKLIDNNQKLLENRS